MTACRFYLDYELWFDLDVAEPPRLWEEVQRDGTIGSVAAIRHLLEPEHTITISCIRPRAAPPKE